MSLTLTAQIEAALATGNVKAVDVVRVWGGDWTLYWSSAPVPARYAGGVNYDPRLVPLSELPFAIGHGDDKIDFEVDNTGGYVRDQIDRGKRFHRARVDVLRLFLNIDPPNNLIGSFGTPYWGGTITGLKIAQKTATFEVSAGILQLNRRALMRMDRSCSAQFADKLTCAYEPTAGKGLPESRFRGTATGGSGTTLVDTGADFVAGGAAAGWVVVNLTDKSAARVTAVAATTLTVDGFANGSDNTMTGGDSYIVGPEFPTCGLSVPNCMDRGMFGIAYQTAAAGLNKDQHRYFTGFSNPARVPFLTKVRDSSGNRSKGRFSVTAQGNSGIEGTPVPYVFGNWRNRECILAGVAFEDRFIDAVYITGMGRQYSISAPDLAGEGPDNPDRSRANSYESQAFHLFNVGYAAAADDSASGDLTTEQLRLGIGSRASYGVSIPQAYDTYANIPYLFNDSTGAGLSWSRVSGFRIRVETTNFNDLSASANIKGAWCRIPPGATGYNNVDGWTLTPNPISVFYHVVRDTVAGGGLSDTQLDLPPLAAASDICDQRITSTQTTQAPISGTVLFGPDDAGSSIPIGERNVVWLTAPEEVTANLIGATITINTSGGNVMRIITSAFVRVHEEDDGGGGGGGGGNPRPRLTASGRVVTYRTSLLGGASFIECEVDEDWEAGKVPAQGNAFTITDAGRVRRYAFDGAITEATSVGEALQAILDNCDGQFVQSNGKISVVIPRPVDLDATDALTIYTDKGANRNIVWRGQPGNLVSTLTWEADDIEESPNAITVEFTDPGNNYETTRRKVWNRTAQEAVGRAFGELRREKEEATLSLNGAPTLDQAVRLAAIRLRRKGALPGNRPNGKVTFDCPIHDCQELQPWADVRVIQSDQIPAYVGRYFRLVEKTDNPDKATCKLVWRPHRNEWYDDSAEDMGVEESPDASRFAPGEPALQSTITSVDSAPFVDGSGVFRERVVVTYTPPVVTS